MTQLSLQSLLTHVAPAQSILTVLAALDVLQNAVSVSVPFYRAALFRLLAKEPDGDPDPIAWIFSSSWHWFLVAVVTASLLLSSQEKVLLLSSSRKEKAQ